MKTRTILIIVCIILGIVIGLFAWHLIRDYNKDDNKPLIQQNMQLTRENQLILLRNDFLEVINDSLMRSNDSILKIKSQIKKIYYEKYLMLNGASTHYLDSVIRSNI